MSSKIKLQLRFRGAVLDRKAVFFRPCHPNQIADAVRIICGLQANERFSLLDEDGDLVAISDALEPGVYEVVLADDDGRNGSGSSHRDRAAQAERGAQAGAADAEFYLDERENDLGSIVFPVPPKASLHERIWRWIRDHGWTSLAGAVGVLAAIVTLIIFVSGKQSLADFLSQPRSVSEAPDASSTSLRAGSESLVLNAETTIEAAVVAAARIRVEGTVALPPDTILAANELIFAPDAKLKLPANGAVTYIAALNIRNGVIDARGSDAPSANDGAGVRGDDAGALRMLTASQSSVAIFADGRAGGDGGKGEIGRNGDNGNCGGFGAYEGAHAGTDGGDGFAGGRGGDGGAVRIVTDATAGLIKASVNSGAGGEGGAPGTGGTGGRGCMGLGGTQGDEPDGKDGDPGGAGARGADGVFLVSPVSDFRKRVEAIRDALDARPVPDAARIKELIEA